MAYEFKKMRRVEFADTDMAGILHFANYVRYVEEAEHDFVRSLGASVYPQGEEGDHPVVFPRLSLRFEYFRPVRGSGRCEGTAATPRCRSFGRAEMRGGDFDVRYPRLYACF